MVLLFDDQRDRLLQNRQPDSKFFEFDQTEVQDYIDLVLSGMGQQARELRIEPHDDLLDDPRTVLYQDVDSALIFRRSSPGTAHMTS